MEITEDQRSPGSDYIAEQHGDAQDNEKNCKAEIAYWGEMEMQVFSGKDSIVELNEGEKMDQAESITKGISVIELCGDSLVGSSGSDGDLLSHMIDRVAKSDAHFKHQQRGDPDLTYEEKSDIARRLYNDKPDQFLARFGKHFLEAHLQLFKHLESDYAVSFYITEVKRILDSKRTQTNVKNRRYQAMLKMTIEGTYFSDEEMKERDPLLYEQMVGQFITEEEANEQVEQEMDRADLRFSTILMKHMQWRESNQLYNAQKDIEVSTVISNLTEFCPGLLECRLVVAFLAEWWPG
jgi:hypothetical protein